MSPRLHCLALPFLVLLAACTENEEEVTVHADGSVSVQMRAKGGAADLADGYLLPLDGPWQPDNPATREWLARVGADTGSAATRAALEALPNASPVFAGSDKREAELAVRADFPSVAAIPHFLAPASDPYQDAFLRRATSLSVRHEPGRTIYAFERRYAARVWARYDMTSHLHLPAELEWKLTEDEPLDALEREQVAVDGARVMSETCAAFAEDALAAIYSHGAAELSPEAHARALAAIAGAVGGAASRERVLALLDELLPRTKGEKHEGEDAHMAEFERGLRDVLRGAMETALAAENLSRASRNVVLGELERLFTAYDHSADLGDDALKLAVHLPGRIVFAPGAKSIDGGTAQFEISGEDLHDREVVQRAVSVVE